MGSWMGRQEERENPVIQLEAGWEARQEERENPVKHKRRS